MAGRSLLGESLISVTKDEGFTSNDGGRRCGVGEG